MSGVSPRSSRPHGAIARALALASILGLQAVWAGTVSAGPATTPPAPVADLTADGAPAGLTPTIHWEDVQKHAKDRITFTPGERATVGPVERGGDHRAISLLT